MAVIEMKIEVNGRTLIKHESEFERRETHYEDHST